MSGAEDLRPRPQALCACADALAAGDAACAAIDESLGEGALACARRLQLGWAELVLGTGNEALWTQSALRGVGDAVRRAALGEQVIF